MRKVFEKYLTEWSILWYNGKVDGAKNPKENMMHKSMNEGYGFYGYFNQKNGDVDAAFDKAVTELIALGNTADYSIAFLDSTCGRHIIDEIEILHTDNIKIILNQFWSGKSSRKVLKEHRISF